MNSTSLASVSALPGKPSASSGDPTPMDWMAFSQLMGWPIAAMASNKPVKFVLSNGEETHVTNQMRIDITAAIERARG